MFLFPEDIGAIDGSVLYCMDIIVSTLISLCLQHNCIYVKRGGKFQLDQAEKQLDQLVSHNIPVRDNAFQMI